LNVIVAPFVKQKRVEQLNTMKSKLPIALLPDFLDRTMAIIGRITININGKIIIKNKLENRIYNSSTQCTIL